MYVKQYSELLKFITNQGINVIFTVVGLFDSIRNWNRKNIDNYIEIFVKADVLQIKKKKKKNLLRKKKIMGVQIKPEFPKKPDIILINDFKSSIKKLSKDLIKKSFNENNYNISIWSKRK